MTIFAHTDNTPAPAFINLSATGPCTVKLTVRSRGDAKTGVTGPSATIDLTNEQLHDLVASAIRHLNKTSK